MKRIISAILIVSLMLSMTTAFAAGTNKRVVLMCYNDSGTLVYSKLLKSEWDTEDIPSEYKSTKKKVYLVDTQEIKDWEDIEKEQNETPSPTSTPQPTAKPRSSSGSGSSSRKTKATPEPEVTEENYVSKFMSFLPADTNYVISPLSLKMAMMMASNGADGDTKTEILNAFDVTDLDSYNSSAKSLIENLNDNEQSAEVNIANSIWFNEDYYKNVEDADFSNDFKEKVSDYYFASHGVVTEDNIIDTINNWIDGQTKGKIQNIVNEQNLDPKETLLSIVNAVYMKERWLHKFDKSETDKDIFTDIDGNEKSIDFMSQTYRFEYFDNGDTKIVSLPYENGLSMYIVLGDTKNFESNIEKMEYKKVHVSMPKFSTEYFVELKEILKNMGVNKAFSDNNPDFNSMVVNVPEPVKIKTVFQKAIIDVDEEGTEAAAVTVIGTAGGGAYDPDEKIFEFKADKPFTYLIRDNASEEILFAGRYVR